MTYECNCNRYQGPQQVRPHGQLVAAPAADEEELHGVEASPATLTVRVQTLGDFMSVVVVLRQRLASVSRCARLLGRVLARRRVGVLSGAAVIARSS